MSVKERYIEEVLRSEAGQMLNNQGVAIYSRLGVKSGRIVWERHFDISASGNSGKLSLRHMIYERFLDMKSIRRNGVRVKRRRRFKIHNKFVWHMYAVIASRLMHGFTEEAAEEIRREYGDAGK